MVSFPSSLVGFLGFHPYMRLFSFRKLFVTCSCCFFVVFFFVLLFRNGKREERWEGRSRGRCTVYKVHMIANNTELFGCYLLCWRNGTSALQRFKCGNTVKIQNGIIFNFDADICPSAVTRTTLLSMLIPGLQCEDLAIQCRFQAQSATVAVLT